MEIHEDSSDEIKNNKNETTNLTLRKPKQNVKNSHKNNNNNIFNIPKSFNELLPGEIELKNEEIIFSHKKRLRSENSSIINNSNSIIDENKINDEEKRLSEKALEIFGKLQISPTPGIKEGDYDSNYHDKREKIIKTILADENTINDQRKLACITKNLDIYCTVLDNFNTFCYYNNIFMVNTHYCLDKIIENAFEFEDKSKSIPLSLKFANTIFDFGFFENYHQKFIDFFIKILLDEEKVKDINSIPRAKIYLYYIIYLNFKDSWENIEIEKEIMQKFVVKILNELNIYDHELTEIIIEILNAICDNILYPKIFKNGPIEIPIIAEINKYMFKLISEIIKTLGQDEIDNILKNDSINFIIKQSFNVIIKIISGINIINENNINLQETLVSKENKYFFYEFIKMFSNLNLNEKNFCWLLDLMAKFADISYYSDIFLKEDIINVIFEKFIIRKDFMTEIFQFMRSLVETKPLFDYFSAYDKFYKAINELDVDKSPFLSCVHFLFIVKELLEKGEEKKCVDSIYDRLCCIQAKEKIEQIFYKHGNEDIIHKKYSEIMPKLDELSKKIDID